MLKISLLAMVLSLGGKVPSRWPVETIAGVAATPATSTTTTPNEYQLVGQAGGLVRLPCLIGKQANCGEPYFIAWYKLNATSRQWMRIEARSPGDQDQDDEGRETMAGGPYRPLADRVQFVWSRTQSPMASSASSCWLGDGTSLKSPTRMLNNGHQQSSQQQQQLLQAALHQQSSPLASLSMISAFQLFDCAQLTIKALELQDEGQYKCEITFSESVEFDRCPASTMTQLNVIGEYDCLLARGASGCARRASLAADS